MAKSCPPQTVAATPRLASGRWAGVQRVQSVLISGVHGSYVSPVADSICRWKGGWYLLCHFAGRGPFGSTLQSDDKAHAGERIHVMTHGGMEHTSFAVAGDQEDGL